MKSARLISLINERFGIDRVDRSRPPAPKTVEFTVVTSSSGAENLASILLAFEAMGKAGSSRGFKLDGYGEFFWDGDGSDRIKSITMDGKPLEQRQFEPEDPDEDDTGSEEGEPGETQHTKLARPSQSR